MDASAEFTLRLIRAGQEALKPLSSLSNWHLVPQCEHLTWSQVSELLAATPKPVIVAGLLEPGWISFWSADSLSPTAKSIVDRECANQREFFAEKLRALGLADDACVETPDGEFLLSVVDFRRWAGEYAVSLGVGMGKSPRPNTGRMHVRLPGGGGPPVGWVG